MILVYTSPCATTLIPLWLGADIAFTDTLVPQVDMMILTMGELPDTPLELPCILVVQEHDPVWLKVADDYVLRSELSEEVLTRAIQRTARDMEDVQRLVKQAQTDPLTRLPNRYALQKSASIKGSTVVFLDLDGFKDYNDTQGHAAGDQVLCNLGGIVTASIAPQDRCYRIGGDEFLCVLAGTAMDGVARAKQLHQRLRALPVGVSMGVTYVQEAHFHAILPIIDAALYQSKRSGKNRVTVV
jgi:diguanylate cyclase (GGDEF)-like protein